VVVADMEAGLEHLSIGTLRDIDTLLVVIQATVKTMMTAHRTYELAGQLGIPEVAFIGNRVSKAADREQLEAFAREHGCELLMTIPEDDLVRWADMQSRCILDVAPQAPTVTAVSRLADRLEEKFALSRAGATTGADSPADAV
jgi:CO dehydrogenase maturation factor